MEISERLKRARWEWRMGGKRQCDLAKAAGVDPTILSGLFSGSVRIVKGDDPRVLRIAKVLGVPAKQAFE
jgi:hypothetical protein